MYSKYFELHTLKGQCHEIFCFWFFSWTSFPQASDYTIKAVSNFFENSRRYSHLKVCHRCQKTFKQKNFNNLVWTPLGSRVNIYVNFCLQVHFKVSAAWYCCHNLPPVSLIPVAICHRRRWHRWQICRRRRWHRWQICRRYRWHRWQICRRYLNNTSENGGKICHRCRWYRWCTLTREYLSEFSKKFETV